MDFPDWYCISQVWKTNKMFNLYLNLYTCIFTLTWEHYFIRSPIMITITHTFLFMHSHIIHTTFTPKIPFHVRNNVDEGKFLLPKTQISIYSSILLRCFAAQAATEADSLMNIRKLLAVESCTFSHLFFIIEFHSLLLFICFK